MFLQNKFAYKTNIFDWIIRQLDQVHFSFHYLRSSLSSSDFCSKLETPPFMHLFSSPGSSVRRSQMYIKKMDKAYRPSRRSFCFFFPLKQIGRRRKKKRNEKNAGIVHWQPVAEQLFRLSSKRAHKRTITHYAGHQSGGPFQWNAAAIGGKEERRLDGRRVARTTPAAHGRLGARPPPGRYGSGKANETRTSPT